MPRDIQHASVRGRKEVEVSTISHEPPGVVQEKKRWSLQLVVEMWASLAIIVMWLAVLFAAGSSARTS
jgi:hypothetical protein